MYQDIVMGSDTSEAIFERVGHLQATGNLKQFKSSSINQTTKQKLERSALERFQQLSSKENEGNQNGKNEKKAQALFKYLRESRMKQQQRNRGHFKQGTTQATP